jgi:uncharacterized protein YbbK (DUF523 family)
MDKETIIISACLVGINCRYDGTAKTDVALMESLLGNILIPVCPEQLGGLPTPRARAEIIYGEDTGKIKVIDEYGIDATRAFKRGARETLKIARLSNAARAILKQGSPSCGVDTITKDGKDIDGSGITAALLKKNNFKITGA